MRTLIGHLSGSGTTRGFILMLIAFFCFSAMDTSAKWLVSIALIPSLQVAFLRYLIHLLWSVVLYAPSEGRAILYSKIPAQQLLRGVLLLCSTALNFTALKYLPLTVTIAIFFAAPMVVCLLSIPLLGERVGIKRFAAVIVGFGGVLIIVQPWGQTFDYHVFFALGALLTASGYFVMTRMIAGIDGNGVAQCYSAGVATVVLAPFAFYFWVWPQSAIQWGLLILLGTLGMLGHTVLTVAHRFAEASVLAPTVYSQIIYITVLGWVIFGSVPDANTIVGALVIVGSGFFIWWRERSLEAAGSAVPVRGGR